jgi:hypothetical protein
LESCAIHLETKASSLIILSLYRAPSGDFNQFIKRSDATLKYLHTPKSEFLICGDINVDHLNENNSKKKLNSLLTTYNLSHTVNFATKTYNVSCTATDNIFVDNTRLSTSYTSPIVNGQSDQDAESLTINNIAVATTLPSKRRTRKINNETIRQFQLQLKN